MPTISESPLAGLQERYKQAVADFVDGPDSVHVFTARLFGLGYRGREIRTELNLAQMMRREKYPLKPIKQE